ncbi:MULTISPECIES: cyclic-di-AMP-binding protein CbpB [unclassified Streptococcus]|uniref:cyclic-di-AMP-binding protein CbpB n=1 Tax=unclassified Streptococcus TaxID=2608887 RepID=UPI0011B51640|nr:MULTISPECIES: cyclic-di-AMP-binding protein CbpB [unclassified Streptococcus]TWT11254.1 CBS domain-containing protein [Streptococcus sp. sy004]TWT16236.1 CBS domain-containing protein [Streptococcus sp. sy010]
MIAKEFEEFLLAHMETYLTPEEELALFIDTHNVGHVLLLLSNNGFSRVPVMTKDKIYVGTISMSDIIHYQKEHELSEIEMADLNIGLMVNKELPTVALNANLTEVMHKLVDASFLPVLQDHTLVGIITRKSILKALNSLLHDFKHYYDISPKSPQE